MALPWFKFYGSEYLGDPKMMPLTPSERSCWLSLLCYGSTAEQPGVIKFLTEDVLMIQSGIKVQSEEWGKTIGVLEKFRNLKMIRIDNDNDNAVITILNWEKRQDVSLTGYERVKRYREKKALSTAIDAAMITSDKIRGDKNTLLGADAPTKKFDVESGLAIWNKLVTWNNSKLPLERLKNKEAIKRVGLLKKCNGVTEQIESFWKKKKVNEDSWRRAINKYIAEIINRDPTNDYCNHRFSMLEFIKQANGYEKFLNR